MLRGALSHLYQSTNKEDGNDALSLLVKLWVARDQEEEHESMQAVYNLNIVPREQIVKFNQRIESYIKRARNAGVILSDDLIIDCWLRSLGTISEPRLLLGLATPT